MAKVYQFIDVEVIWKAIYGEASREETEVLEKWIDEDIYHKRYYENAQKFFRSGSAFGGQPSELEDAWNKFQRKERKSNKRIARAMSIAASVVAAVMIIGSLFLYTTKTRNELIAEKEQSLITPGTDKAILVFDDGRTVDLAKKTDLIIEDGSAKIRNNGSKIEYISSGKGEKKLKYNMLKVPRGGQFFLVLADGTRVWLNAETIIRYPVEFRGNERKIELNGEAFFEVTKNKSQPFKVYSGNQIVEVFGTSFNISSYYEDPVAITTLIEGKVEVSLKDNPGIKQVLSPNDQSCNSKANNILTKRTVDPYKYVAWKEGRFVFEDERLLDIMKTLSKWYDVDFLFSNVKAEQYRFTGNLERYSNIEDIFSKIEKTNEVKFKVKGREIIIE